MTSDGIELLLRCESTTAIIIVFISVSQQYVNYDTLNMVKYVRGYPRGLRDSMNIIIGAATATSCILSVDYLATDVTADKIHTRIYASCGAKKSNWIIYFYNNR